MTEAMSTMSRLLKRRAGGVRTEFSEKPRGAGENHQPARDALGRPRWLMKDHAPMLADDVK